MLKVNENYQFPDRPALCTSKMSSDLLDFNKNMAYLIQLAKEVVSRTSEIRSERVERLKKTVEAGTYEIDSSKLAASWLRVFSDI